MDAHTGEFRLLDRPSRTRNGRLSSTGHWIASTAVAIGIAAGAAWIARPHPGSRPAQPMASATIPAGPVASLGRRRSHGGKYAAEVVSTTPLIVGATESWTIHLTRRNQQRVAHARVTVQPWMPETADRRPAMTARYIGHGDYRVDGVVLPRAGWWNVALVIVGRAGIDSVAFNVILPPRSPAVAMVEWRNTMGSVDERLDGHWRIRAVGRWLSAHRPSGRGDADACALCDPDRLRLGARNPLSSQRRGGLDRV
ncbi:MAG: FixH family protein [Gemmatimonadaceae bacterium]